MSSLSYNPVNGDFTNQLPMKKVDKLSYLNSIEDCMRQSGETIPGSFYPVRVAPAASIDKDAEWPIIMPAGSIVSVLDLKDASQYISGDAEAGILPSGMINVSISETTGEALKKNINHVYDKEIPGLITICNGGTQHADPYEDEDGENGIIDIDGNIASTVSADYTRSANVPMGIAFHRVPADMRMRYLNYDAGNEVSVGNTIMIGGEITIPYVIIYSTVQGDRDTVQAAIRNAVDNKHQYLWTSVNTTDSEVASASVKSSVELKSDIMGKFTKFVRASDNSTDNQYFGKIISLRNRIPYNMDEWIDSFPGSGMKGTDTGGLSSRMFNFVKSIIVASGIKTTGITGTIAQVKSALGGFEAETGDVKLMFGQACIAFGSRK